MLIVDEMHEFLTGSAQGHGTQRLASCAKKILGLTGTLFNGYAENLYNMFLYFYPEKIKNEYQEYIKQDPEFRGGMKSNLKIAIVIKKLNILLMIGILTELKMLPIM